MVISVGIDRMKCGICGYLKIGGYGPGIIVSIPIDPHENSDNEHLIDGVFGHFN